MDDRDKLKKIALFALAGYCYIICNNDFYCITTYSND